MKQKVVITFAALASSVVVPVALLRASSARVKSAVVNGRENTAQQTSSPNAPAPTFNPWNPFAQPSTLAFKAPPFDKIKDSDYQPAIEEGMRRQIAEVEAIANSPEAPSLANTIEALERTGEMLTRVESAFSGMLSSNSNPILQKVQIEEAPKLAAHHDAIYLNDKLFARVKAIYDQRKTLRLAPDAEYLVEHYYRDFVRAGALLSEADKNTLRAMNKELAQLRTQF